MTAVGQGHHHLGEERTGQGQVGGPGMSLTIRPAAPADAPLIYGFIRELADYEKLLHAVEASQADIAEVLFCAAPRAFLAEIESGKFLTIIS